MKPVIEVSDLSKKYEISHQTKPAYGTIKDNFSSLLKKPFNRSDKDKRETFWALKDISFEVAQGEIFGVIGRNGSGKSTLLKVLSRIIEPDKGNVVLRGRTASLLEVGTGFHPELTGRENVYFNGSMLGMSRLEINNKFQEIVDFSEIEKFLDTPVKFYSSGMYVRLAFAVAAHLDPDILILDEVLAVGDASFQKKSLKKILSSMNEGKTVLFVSHSMDSVRQLCSRGVLLENGGITASGAIDGLIEKYSLETDQRLLAERLQTEGSSWKNDGKIDNEYFSPTNVYITNDKNKKVKDQLYNHEDYWINIEGILKKHDPHLNIGYCVWDDEGRNLLYQTFTTDSSEKSWPKLRVGTIKLRAKLPKYLLNTGLYKLKLISSIYAKFWIMDPDSSPVKLTINVRHGKRDSPLWPETRGGILSPVIDWESKN